MNVKKAHPDSVAEMLAEEAAEAEDARAYEDWITTRDYEDQAREWSESVQAAWEHREEWLDFMCGQPEEW